ncbi:MAG TPA: gluconate 2-dehydrogenase subunit 3 family protein, partial [Gemmatimonadaceae bacterium]
MSIEQTLIDRREAIRRVTAMLGGVALVGGSTLIAACERGQVRVDAAPESFTPDEIAFLDEIADTILPDTKTPGAKAAKTGAFMALMVSDTYSPNDQKIFREGMGKVNDAMQTAHDVTFMLATPQQRLDVLTALDREQKAVMDARDAADRRRRGLAPVTGVVLAGDPAISA